MDKVRLLFDNVAEISGNDNIAIITLTDELKMRVISIVCDMQIAVALKMRMHNEGITKTMLPEVAVRMLRAKGDLDYELLISGIDDGQYEAMLVDKVTGMQFAVRISDGILFSVVADIPVYMEQNLMERQSVANMHNTNGVSVPVNIISVPMLEESLKKAIEEENYEMASKLHSELERRKKNHDKEEL